MHLAVGLQKKSTHYGRITLPDNTCRPKSYMVTLIITARSLTSPYTIITSRGLVIMLSGGLIRYSHKDDLPYLSGDSSVNQSGLFARLRGFPRHFAMAKPQSTIMTSLRESRRLRQHPPGGKSIFNMAASNLFSPFSLWLPPTVTITQFSNSAEQIFHQSCHTRSSTPREPG